MREERFIEGEYVAAMDTGASKHILNRHIRLLNERSGRVWMTSATGARTLLEEEGDLELQTADSDGNPLDPLLLSDCSKLKGSPLNLLSVSMLCDQGTTFHFEKKNSYFVHRGHKFRLEERHGLYLIRLNDVLSAEELKAPRQEHDKSVGHDLHTVDKSNVFGCAATYDLWHERFGHAHPRRIKFLYDNGSVEGLDVGGKFKHNRSYMLHDKQREAPHRRVAEAQRRDYAERPTRDQRRLRAIPHFSRRLPLRGELYRRVLSF